MSEWQEILNEVNNVFLGSPKYRRVWFRGINNTSHSLDSGLYRIKITDMKLDTIEKNMFYLFNTFGDSLLDIDKENKWNVLFCMQHYGMKTRLLDWTNSFITSLYFANLKRKENSIACIWVLDPYALNKLANKKFQENQGLDNIYAIDNLPKICKDYSAYYESTELVPSFALIPKRNTKRLLVQNGVFTVQGNQGLSLDQEYPELIANRSLVKIELPWSTYEESVNYLEMNGVNYFSLFPELDGLSKYINDEVLFIKTKESGK